MRVRLSCVRRNKVRHLPPRGGIEEDDEQRPPMATRLRLARLVRGLVHRADSHPPRRRLSQPSSGAGVPGVAGEVAASAERAAPSVAHPGGNGGGKVTYTRRLFCPICGQMVTVETDGAIPASLQIPDHQPASPSVNLCLGFVVVVNLQYDKCKTCGTDIMKHPSGLCMKCYRDVAGTAVPHA